MKMRHFHTAVRNAEKSPKHFEFLLNYKISYHCRPQFKLSSVSKSSDTSPSMRQQVKLAPGSEPGRASFTPKADLCLVS